MAAGPSSPYRPVLSYTEQVKINEKPARFSETTRRVELSVGDPTPQAALTAGRSTALGSIQVAAESAGQALRDLFDYSRSGLTPVQGTSEGGVDQAQNRATRQVVDGVVIETSVVEEAKSRQETTLKTYPDGSTEKRVKTSTSIPGGDETVVELWDREGYYVKTVQTRVNGHCRDEVTHCKPDGSLRRTTTTDIPAPPDRTIHEYSKDVEDGRVTEKLVRREVDEEQNSVVTEETLVDGRFVRKVTTTTLASPDLDLPGQGWIGSHNPQDLLKHLKDQSRVRGVKVVEESLAPDGSRQVHTSITLTSGEGDVELIEHKIGDGPSTWELRKRNSDGSWNSQLFFQGTEDTVVTRSHKDGNWDVEVQDARTEQLAQATEDQLPSAVHSETFTCQFASASDIEQRLNSSGMAEVCQSDCYVLLMADSPGPYETFINIETSTKRGQKTTSGAVVLRATDGTFLTATFDGARKLTSACLHPRGAAQPAHLSFVSEGERLEIDQDGRTEEVVEGARHVLDRTGTASGAARSFFDDMKARESAVVRVGTKWADRIGVCAGSAVIALTALQLATAIADGDVRTALVKSGELGLNLSIVIKTLDDSAWKSGGGKGSWLSRGGKLLGAAGIIVGMANTVQTALDGNTSRAVVGAAGVAGGALTLMAGAGWTGPVGWGLIGLSILGGMALDYSDQTRVADCEI